MMLEDIVKYVKRTNAERRQNKYRIFYEGIFRFRRFFRKIPSAIAAGIFVGCIGYSAGAVSGAGKEGAAIGFVMGAYMGLSCQDNTI